MAKSLGNLRKFEWLYHVVCLVILRRTCVPPLTLQSCRSMYPSTVDTSRSLNVFAQIVRTSDRASPLPQNIYLGQC